MSINFNKLFIQDIITRRGSHAIDLGESNEQSDEDGDSGSDYYNDTSSDTLGEMESGVQAAELLDDQASGSSQKSRLLAAIQDLRAAVEKQNNLQTQMNGRVIPSNMHSYKEHDSSERYSRRVEKEALSKTDSTHTVTPAPTSAQPSSTVTAKPAEDVTKKPLIKVSEEEPKQSDRLVESVKLRTPTTETTHKKRLISQSGSTDTAETDLISFKRCERLSKKKDKVVVEVRVVFLKIGEIDTLKEIYHADAFIQVKWREPRLDGKSEEDLRRIDLQRCWNPLVLIDNILSESKDQHWMLTQKSDQNEVFIVERRRLRGIFLETLELNDFPLDVQDLTITLTSERPDSEVILVPDQNELCGINLQTLVDQQEWKLHEHIEVTRRSATQEYTNSSQSHPCISVTCRAARRPGYFYWNVFLIMFFITGLSFATFAVPPERPENRLQLSFTLFLTSVAFKFVINQSLPKISYLTYMDKYVLMSLAILCVVSIWHAMVTLIPTDVVFEREDMMDVLKIPSLDNSAAMSPLNQNGNSTTEAIRSISSEVLSNSSKLEKQRTSKILITTLPAVQPSSTTARTRQDNQSSPIQAMKVNPFSSWDAEQWKKFAQQSTDLEQEKRVLKLRIERDVFASFCVLYGLAHLTFVFWLYFDASKRRREMVERDRQYKRCLQASKAVQ